MKNELTNVQRILRDLLKSLPAIKDHSTQDTISKHVALIRYYQDRYDHLAAKSAVPA